MPRGRSSEQWNTEVFDGVPVTPRQLDILWGIESFWREHQHAPTTRDLCEIMGVASTNAINCHMVRLRKKGLVDRTDVGRGLKTSRTQVRAADGGLYVFWER